MSGIIASKWTTDRRVLAGLFLAALLVLAVVFFISNWTTGNLMRATQLRDHRHEVIEKLQMLLTELDDAETGQRGFLITGAPSYLEPYETARDTVRGTTKALESLLHDAEMRKKLATLEPLVEAKLSELQKTIDLRRSAGFAPAQQIVLTNRGKQIMDHIRRITSQMHGREEMLLAQSQKAASKMGQDTISIRLVGNVLSFGLLLGVFLLLAREIRARKKSEADLRTTEERYRLVSNQVRDYAILMLDPQGNVETWNEGAQRINGYSGSEILGRNFSLFYLPEDVAAGKPEHELETAKAEGRLEDKGWRVRQGGARYWANTIITPLWDEAGKLRGYSKITRDETDRKLAEDAMQRLNEALERRTAELEAANRELEAFTYSVSHDLRAPLRHVDGFSKLLAEESAADLSDDAKRYLDYVREGVIQMGQLVDDLLALARVGRKELTVQVTGLNSLVGEVVAELKRDNPDREIEWKVESLPFVECDAALMRQVFANLLSNSVKYTRPRPRASIEIGTLQEDGQRAVYVRDNGVGFNMKYADKLFGVFQRLHRPEDFEGTGVGLATVQRIIHKHGGRIWAQAAVDQGAAFYFTLGNLGEGAPPHHPAQGGEA